MLINDLALAVRHLIRRPGYTVTALLLLALGAGANAAVFSVVRGVLIRPLAYHQPEQLVMLWPNTFVSNEDVAFWRERARALEQAAAISPGWMMSLVVPGKEPIKVTGGRTSDNFFTTLGAQPALGRTIRPGDAVPGASRVVVLSAQLHAQHFGGDASVIGKHVFLDGTDYEVIGVMPKRFEFLQGGTDVWAPLAAAPGDTQYRAQFSQAFGRLRPGVSAERAQTELRDLVPAMRESLKRTEEWGRGERVVTMQEQVTGDVRTTLFTLLAAVGLILLLAAVNLGTLVLSRSIERAREMAVRTALGATRGRLWRQLVVEQAVLASGGAAAGLALAWLLLPVLIRRIPPDMPRQSEVTLDLVVFAVVFGATVLVSVLMALVPVAAAARPELQPLLRERAGTETPARRRTLGSLVTAQIALAVVLGIGAGLMLRTMWNLQRVDPGFTARDVLTFRLQTTSRPMNLARGMDYFEQVLSRVRTLPGVVSVGAIQHLPMSGYNWTSAVWRPENPPPPGATRPQAMWRFVGWEYFTAMGIPFVAGRPFAPQDRLNAAPVAIINESLAKKHFGSAGAAIGQRLATATGRGETVTEVVGVTRDVRFRTLDKPAEPEMYRPLAQTFMFPMAFVVRTQGDPAQVATGVRQAAFAVDPSVAVAELQPLTQLIAGTLGRPRLLAVLLSVFAAAGLALCVVGVYGVVAYRVRQREREFGIRLALGAGPSRIAQSVARQGIAYAAIGITVGVPVAFLLTRLMDTMLYGVTSRDPVTFVLLPIAVTLATAAACAVPARRAARISPMKTMRGD